MDDLFTLPHLLEAFGVVTGVAGNALVSARRRFGFWLWLPGNIGNVALFALNKQWGYCALFIYYSFTCLFALRYWPQDNQTSNHE